MENDRAYFLLSLLVVRHMWREHPRMISKNADYEHGLEELSALPPCFIDILLWYMAVCFLKR
jgi:hypothetical protein